jgi:hypothetical protein
VQELVRHQRILELLQASIAGDRTPKLFCTIAEGEELATDDEDVEELIED